MSGLFEELDWRPTPIGAVSLRRRRDLATGADVYEVKLGDDFLMSSLFTASEIALARLALADLEAGARDVVVGGLGLGYTAQAALADPRVRALVVVEYLDAVADWHESGLVPLGRALVSDPRFSIRRGDFFAMAAGEGFDPARPGRAWDAILLDIDHTPEALLDDRSRAFYKPAGLARLLPRLRPGGVFGLWSNDRPDPVFTERLARVFGTARAEEVTFHNPIQNLPAVQTVYLARKPVEPSA